MEIIQIKRELLITMENYIIQMDFMQKKSENYTKQMIVTRF